MKLAAHITPAAAQRVAPTRNIAVSNRVIGQMLTCCGTRLLRIASLNC